jgi:hypothetical protein
MRGSQKFPEFFDIDSLVHHEFVPSGQSVPSYFYLQVLQRLCDAVTTKRHDKCQGQWFPNHNNDRATHRLLCSNSSRRKTFLTSPNHHSLWITLQVTGCSFLKMGFKGTCFRTMEGIKLNATAKLWKIPKETLYQCFQQWPDQWHKCVCVCARACVCTQ